MENIQKAILQAKVEGVLKNIIIRTNAENVMYDDSTTLAAKLAEMLTNIGLKANSSDVTSQIQTAVDTAINNLIDGAPETYNTLREIAEYIEAHEDVKEALEQSVGAKLDQTTFTTFCNSVEKLGALAGKDTVSEDDLAPALKEKVNAASEGNHSHNNKNLLDDIDADDITSWDDAASKAHEHDNSETLDKITEAKLAELEGKATVYFSKNEPQNLKNGDLWFQLVD